MFLHKDITDLIIKESSVRLYFLEIHVYLYRQHVLQSVLYSRFGGCPPAAYCSFINIKWTPVFENFFGVKDVHRSLIRNIMVASVRTIVHKFTHHWSCKFILLDHWNGSHVNVNKTAVPLNLHLYKDIFKKKILRVFFWVQ